MLSVLGLAGLAGALSTLSPCVLPLLPIVLGAAASEHRLGPAALAGGLALSFTVVGLFVATIGFAIGLDEGVFRLVGGALLAGLGVVLLAPALQERVAVAAGPVGDWTQRRFGAVEGGGVGGQAAVGILLGIVWAPCVGPTLGAASLMAARGENLGQVALTMLAFGLGAAAPLLLLGTLSREAMARWRGRLLGVGSGGKQALGLLLLAVGLAVATGAEKQIEAWLVSVSPAWLTALTTRF